MAQFFSKNRFFATTHDKPTSQNGISLQSPSLIMAPGHSGHSESWICNENINKLILKEQEQGLQCSCTYRIELKFHLREDAVKEMQDAIDGAGMNGQVKIF